MDNGYASLFFKSVFLIFSSSKPSRAPLPPPPSKAQFNFFLQAFFETTISILSQNFLIFSASNPRRAPLPPPPSKSQQEITLKQPEAS